MIIEFIGPPGAGKTTFLSTVIDYFHERDLQAYTVVDAARPFAGRTVGGKLIRHLAPAEWQRPLLWRQFYLQSWFYRFKFMAHHPRLVREVFASQKQRPAEAGVRERKVLPWFFHLLGSYEFLKAQARRDEVLLFDEGFVHRVVQHFASAVETPQKAPVLAYLDLLPQPDLVIFVQAPWEVCERRIYNRGLWQRFQEKEPAEITQFVINAHQIVGWAVEHIKQRGWTMIEVDNGGDNLDVTRAALRCQMDQAPAITGGVRELQAA